VTPGVVKTQDGKLVRRGRESSFVLDPRRKPASILRFTTPGVTGRTFPDHFLRRRKRNQLALRESHAGRDAPLRRQGLSIFAYLHFLRDRLQLRRIFWTVGGPAFTCGFRIELKAGWSIEMVYFWLEALNS